MTTKDKFNMNDFVSLDFTNKHGIKFTTRPHYATFSEYQNASKVKVLMVLYHRRHTLLKTSGLTTGELHKQSGVSYGYLCTRVRRWLEWGYITFELTSIQGKPVYAYKIDKRGEHMIEDIVPREWLVFYLAEIKKNKAT